jgi:protein O-GlcNAc transferase
MSAPDWLKSSLSRLERGDAEGASRLCLARLAEEPRDGPVLIFATEILRRAGAVGDAVRVGQEAVAAAATHPAAHNNLGLAWLAAQRPDAAADCFRQALELDSGYVRAYHNLAKLWIEQGRLRDAEEILRRVLARNPADAWAINGLGAIAQRRYQFRRAMALFERALEVDPGLLRARLNRVRVLVELGRAATAETELRALLETSPRQADAWGELGGLYDRQRRPDLSLEAYQRAYALRPHDPVIRAALADSRRKVCEWRDPEGLQAALLDEVRECIRADRVPPLPALTSLRFPTSPEEQLGIARLHARRILAGVEHLPKPVRAARSASRLRIGILTHEFRQNVVGQLWRHLPRAFDRSRVEIHGFIYNPDDGSAVRRDLVEGCDRFHDLTDRSPWPAAQHIAGQGIDILLDLNSYMQDGRPEIAALRPAPVQVSYMYPGTMGAPWIDYLLTDEVATPPEHAAHYSERLVYLPPSYLPAMGLAPIAGEIPGRGLYGLPEDAVVFCSFNREDKIDPETFSAWTEILRAVPRGVLWISASAPARANLRREAARAAIDPDRLVFADNEPDMGRHLARHRHADLFLDCFIHNAHATAADALWAGLPVLTRLGPTFAGRVAASLLTAVGLPELIARDTAGYCRQAIALAHDPAQLRRLGSYLAASRATAPLFDPVRLAECLTLAFEDMWERYRCRRSGLSPTEARRG